MTDAADEGQRLTFVDSYSDVVDSGRGHAAGHNIRGCHVLLFDDMSTKDVYFV